MAAMCDVNRHVCHTWGPPPLASNRKLTAVQCRQSLGPSDLKQQSNWPTVAQAWTPAKPVLWSEQQQQTHRYTILDGQARERVQFRNLQNNEKALDTAELLRDSNT